MSAADLCQEIIRRRTEKLDRNIRAYPRANPIASDLGSCLRETVFAITHWQEKPLFDADVKARLDRGNLIEDAVLQELGSLGLKVRVERKPFEIRDREGRLILRGIVDGFISHNGIDVPFEVKSMSPSIFQRINQLEDFKLYSWTRKYPRQLQAYLYHNELEDGFFLLDDLAGHWKLIPVALDFEEMEKILQQCERAVEHIANKTLPDFASDPQTCLKCWAFGRVCHPPFFSEGMVSLDDPEIEFKLDRRGELEEAKREYDRLDKQVKELFKGKNNLVIGNWLIQGEDRHRKPYQVPESTYWQSRIERIQGTESKER